MQIPYLHKSRPKLGPLSEEQSQLAKALRKDVEILATDIGPRGTHSPQRYALAADFIENALRKAGYAPSRHWFMSFDNQRCCNIDCSLVGTSRPERILVVGAHYDSVICCPAANDNASGVAGTLALARALAGEPLPCTVRFVFFANEEPPHFNLNQTGSSFYVQRCVERNEDIRGMICLETIGCYKYEKGSQEWPIPALGYVLPTVGDFIALVGPDSARSFIKPAAAAFAASKAFPLLAASAPAAIQQVNWSDHRAFNEAGFPAFMLTDTAPYRYNHYHLTTDTPDRLDYESMARVISGTREMTVTLVRELARYP